MHLITPDEMIQTIGGWTPPNIMSLSHTTYYVEAEPPTIYEYMRMYSIHRSM